ncbi:hypothetical protein [Prescottella agglutinans]|uniref:hypothetical protein n=1 Tax=Prescottella agglutinans TaxID=1644129 RepID=UPI003D991757
MTDDCIHDLDITHTLNSDGIPVFVSRLATMANCSLSAKRLSPELEALQEETLELDREWFEKHPWAGRYSRPLSDAEAILYANMQGLELNPRDLLIVHGAVTVIWLTPVLRARLFHDVTVSLLPEPGA